jgi:single-stranded DNA-binding protein
MIDSLLYGRLVKTPQQGTNSHGDYLTCCMSVPTRDGNTLLANCVTSKPDIIAALSSLSKGDAVALAGDLLPQLWTQPDGETRLSLSVIVHAVTSAYSVTRKRETQCERMS